MLPLDADDFDTVPRPVVALATDYLPGHEIAPHRHRRVQLVHAATGVMTVTTEHGAWVVPPGRAVWVPPGVEHRIRAQGNLAMRTVYIAVGAGPQLGDDCCVVNVSPLLRELILAAMAMPRLYSPDGPNARLVAVLLDQLRSVDIAPLHLPLPDDRRLRRVTEGLLADPGNNRCLSDWAQVAGASGRTLARVFIRETGMTFGQWRQQVRLLEALRRMAVGQSVLTVAVDLGYESASAFIVMFRRALGTTPGRYFD
jgi:AraC-like DNA-binding protein